jgi:hypothetical protein
MTNEFREYEVDEDGLEGETLEDCMCDFGDHCGGTGWIDCAGCGGDNCICTCGGGIECWGCPECPDPDAEDAP